MSVDSAVTLTDLREAEGRANRWALKHARLVLWVRQNCTEEQIAAAREATRLTPGDCS